MAYYGLGRHSPGRKEAAARPHYRRAAFHAGRAARDPRLLRERRRRAGGAAGGHGARDRGDTGPLQPGAPARPLCLRGRGDGAARRADRRWTCCGISAPTGRASRRCSSTRWMPISASMTGPPSRPRSFMALAEARGWAWPMLPSGAPSLEAKTFREMAEVFPEIEPLRQLRSTMGELRLNDIAVGPDGRNRTLLSPFGTKTGRNAPSSSRFIFGPAVWARFMIRPEPGMALAYMDFASQEIAIAAAFSGDERLAEAALDRRSLYRLRQDGEFGACRRDQGNAWRDSRPHEGGSARRRLRHGRENTGVPAPDQRERSEAPPAALQRSLSALCPMARGSPEPIACSACGRSTIFGWTFEPDDETRPNTLRNWPIQSAGAEILRWTCSVAVERGIGICAPIHDAVLIEAPIDEIEDGACRMQRPCRKRRAWCSSGMEIRIDTRTVRHPDHYTDKRGTELFRRVIRLLKTLNRKRRGTLGLRP